MKSKEFWLRYVSLVLPTITVLIIFMLVPNTYKYLFGLLASLLIFVVASLSWIYHRPPESQIPWGILLMITLGIVGIGSLLVQPNNFWLNLSLGLIATQIRVVYFLLVIKESKNRVDTPEMENIEHE